jgi:hypothetical protein
MRADLAERLLKEVMGWDTGEFAERVRDLQALAAVKYDEYGNYGPGSKFVENLAAWLAQFPPDKRKIAFDFVLRRLVFISEVEIGHLISLVYPEIIAPTLRQRVADEIGISVHRVAEIERHDRFIELRRRSLIVGASDGARLDRLRRASPLSHEQFFQGARPTVEELRPAVDALVKAREAPEGTELTFGQVFFVDDFSGSGHTLVRKEDGSYTGKLVRLDEQLQAAATAEPPLVDDSVPVTVVLYSASEQALEHASATAAAAGLDSFDIRTVQVVPRSQGVDLTDEPMTALCREFFDETTVDPHKGEAPIGFADCALPVVLSHNTPNNSICLLWMDTTDRPGSNNLKALFPRYERHHPDRK